MTMENTIVDKTTTVKTAEPLHLKLERFAKFSKISMTLNLDPNNPITLDQMILPVQNSNTKFAVEAFKTLCVEQLGATITDDNGETVKTLTSDKLVAIRQKQS